MHLLVVLFALCTLYICYLLRYVGLDALGEVLGVQDHGNVPLAVHVRDLVTVQTSLLTSISTQYQGKLHYTYST